MKSVFIDTNVILDFLADRQPFSEDATILFQLAKDRKIKMYVSAISFNNTYYILRKVVTHEKALQLLIEIDEYVTTIDTTHSIIKKSISSGFSDFEDAIQYFSALEVGNLDLITTRDLKGFKKSEIPVLSPDTLVKIILNKLKL